MRSSLPPPTPPARVLTMRSSLDSLGHGAALSAYMRTRVCGNARARLRYSARGSHPSSGLAASAASLAAQASSATPATGAHVRAEPAFDWCAVHHPTAPSATLWLRLAGVLRGGGGWLLSRWGWLLLRVWRPHHSTHMSVRRLPLQWGRGESCAPCMALLTSSSQ